MHFMPIYKLFIDLYYDDFGTYQNVYHSLGGIYLQFENMPAHQRKLIMKIILSLDLYHLVSKISQYITLFFMYIIMQSYFYLSHYPKFKILIKQVVKFD